MEGDHSVHKAVQMDVLVNIILKTRYQQLSMLCSAKDGISGEGQGCSHLNSVKDSLETILDAPLGIAISRVEK